MGSCATKPKADATDAPAPLPEKDEVEKKELTVAGSVIETKEEVVDADKSRSLSNLFKQSEQVKGLSENDKTHPEMVKEEACEAKESTDISDPKTTEVVKSEILVETTPAPAVIAVVAEAEKAIEVEAATDKFEISVEKTAIPIANAPATVKAEEAIEVETTNEESETLGEKISTPIIYATVEDEADKEIEVALATEVQKTVAVEDTNIEEHEKALETLISESTEAESTSNKTETVEEKAANPIVLAHVEVEADTEIEVAAANEIQKNEVVEKREIDKHDKVVETQKSELPETIAEESKQNTELEKSKILPDEEIQESNIEEEKAVTEDQKAIEGKITETEVCAENVKP